MKSSMSRIFSVDIGLIQPSQLFLSEEKIDKVEKLLHDQKSKLLNPLPIKNLNGDLIYTDGHTRAYIAMKSGIKRINVVWDHDELDWDLYRICVQWCRADGIFTIYDLDNRILPHYEYEIKWLQRCQNEKHSLN